MSKRLGFVLHSHRPEAWELAHQAMDWCRAQSEGEEDFEALVSLPPADAQLVDRPDLAVAEESFGKGLDVCISIGGDGTMLRASQLVSDNDVPILGVNVGRLGYLTEVDPEHLLGYLEAWKSGALTVEERMMVEVSTQQANGDSVIGYALNEAVVYRSESGRTLDVLVAIGGEPFTDYLADGVIVATPTGSTAYSLSAGGPIVEPDFHALLLTPVAAHMVFNRSMILAPTTEVTLTVKGYRGAVVALDGRTVLELEPGQSVVCRGSQRTAKLLVRGDRDFHTILKEKFGLVDKECL